MTFKIGDRVRVADTWEGEIVSIDDGSEVGPSGARSIRQPFGVAVNTAGEGEDPFLLAMFFSEDQLEAASD